MLKIVTMCKNVSTQIHVYNSIIGHFTYSYHFHCYTLKRHTVQQKQLYISQPLLQTSIKQWIYNFRCSVLSKSSESDPTTHTILVFTHSESAPFISPVLLPHLEEWPKLGSNGAQFFCHISNYVTLILKYFIPLSPAYSFKNRKRLQKAKLGYYRHIASPNIQLHTRECGDAHYEGAMWHFPHNPLIPSTECLIHRSTVGRYSWWTKSSWMKNVNKTLTCFFLDLTGIVLTAASFQITDINPRFITNYNTGEGSFMVQEQRLRHSHVMLFLVNAQ